MNERRFETLCGDVNGGYKDGSFEEAAFCYPFGIAFNPLTEELYVSDTWNNAIRVISLKSRNVRTLCGHPQAEGFENGVHDQAKFSHPLCLGSDIRSNHLYVTEEWSHVVRRISLAENGRVDTLCGTVKVRGGKDGILPTFNHLCGITVDSRSQSIYVVDTGNNKIRKITINASLEIKK